MKKQVFLALLIGSVANLTLPAQQPVLPPGAGALPSTPSPAATANPASPAATNTGAKIQFANVAPDLGKVKGSEPAKFTFVFTNTGCQTLEVSSVVPHCGCTMAGEWTKRVDPGQTGNIPVQVNVSTAWPAGPFAKTVTVNCNDTSQPPVTLTIKGTLWKPIDISPPNAMINVAAGQTAPASAVVRVVNNTDEPLSIWDPVSNNATFTTEIKTNQAGKEYLLVISTKPSGTPGSIPGSITVKTSSTNMPLLNVPVYANVQAPPPNAAATVSPLRPAPAIKPTLPPAATPLSQ